LVQSTSVEATPKRKTERVLSAPGTAIHSVTPEKTPVSLNVSVNKSFIFQSTTTFNIYIQFEE